MLNYCFEFYNIKIEVLYFLVPRSKQPTANEKVFMEKILASSFTCAICLDIFKKVNNFTWVENNLFVFSYYNILCVFM